MKIYRFTALFLCASLLALPLSSCVQKNTSSTLSGARVNRRALVTASDYLRQANSASAADALHLQCQAAQALVANSRFSEAQALIKHLKSSGLTGTDLHCFQLAQADLYLKTGRARSAKSLLVTMRFQPAALNPADQRKHLALLGQAYAALEQRLMFIKTQAQLIQMEARGPGQRAHIVRLWEMLARYPQSRLSLWLKQVPVRSDTAGWLELAAIMGKHPAGGADWYRALSGWKATYKNHPAKQLLPKLSVAQNAPMHSQPKSVALLLPLTGPYAKQGLSVRRGFYAAYYAHQKQQSMTVRVIDSNSAPMSSLLQQIKDQGIHYIVGPLLKEKVQALGELPLAGLHVLALNTTQRAVPEMMQFSLSPESNIDQIVAKMATEKKWRVAVIMPDTSYAQRLFAHFKQLWTGYGGDVVGVLSYRKAGNQAAELRHFLGVDQARARHRAVQKVVGQKLRFLARPRQDIDAFLFLGNRKSAASFKPLLRFYFLGKRPFFAMPRVGSFSAHRRQADLNGIDYLATPWQLLPVKQMPEALAVIRTQLKKLWPASTKKYAVFYAMGADAYSLTNLVGAFSVMPGFSYFGQTGLLTVDASNRVFPRLLWATFKRGKPALIKQVHV